MDDDFEFEIPFLIACVAKRGSGKSFLTKYLVKHWIDNNKFSEIMAFTNTNDVNKEYDYLKSKFIFGRYDESRMSKILEAQKKQIKSKGKEKTKDILVIMDDVIGSLSAYSPTMRELITQGRHYKISLILNIQISKKEFTPEFRQNCDYFIIGYNGKNTFKNLFEELEFNGTLNNFLQFMNNNTTNFNFVVYINKVMKDYEFEKRYKLIHAEDSEELKKFKIK